MKMDKAFGLKKILSFRGGFVIWMSIASKHGIQCFRICSYFTMLLSPLSVR